MNNSVFVILIQIIWNSYLNTPPPTPKKKTFKGQKEKTQYHYIAYLFSFVLKKVIQQVKKLFTSPSYWTEPMCIYTGPAPPWECVVSHWVGEWLPKACCLFTVCSQTRHFKSFRYGEVVICWIYAQGNAHSGSRALFSVSINGELEDFFRDHGT